ncbi:hypothetical protein [Halohasta salina]|uniref:hypothetical protein n=1 Tax=Halohasta salina TaxID=2961621 RepID=UPI0020A48C6D|nr:hypothetical protein [Halohasta salina]
MSTDQQELASGVDGKRVDCCPNCGSTRQLSRRVPSSPLSPHDDSADKYRCGACRWTGDSLDERPAQQSSGNVHGTAEKLLKANAEDWP